MNRPKRTEVLASLRAEAVIGGGPGSGLSAKCQELGGIDLLTVFNSGRFRIAGQGSPAGLLAYGNANEIVVEMGWEILPVVVRTPVLAGATAPTRSTTPRGS
jgi:predicted TIM-barrel enzyme